MAAPPVAVAGVAAAPPPVPSRVALDSIAINRAVVGPLIQNAQVGNILEYESFCEQTGFTAEAGSSKPQYAAYLLALLRRHFPAHQLDHIITGFQRLLLREDRQSMLTLKNNLDTFYQAITGLVPFAQLTPANKTKKFVIDEHQSVHYQGGSRKDKNHFNFAWATVHKLTMAAVLEILTQGHDTDGDYILLINETGKAKVLAEETNACRTGYIKLQMGTAGREFSGHIYPLDNAAADKEAASAIPLNWTAVVQFELTAVNNSRRN